MAELTKKELVEEIAAHCEEPQAAVERVLGSFVDIVNQHVADGDIVGLPGLGKFQAAPTAARTARNPHTGEEIQVEASYRAKFKPAQRLKDSAKA
jgi:DNA-binding protein HU-beta